MSHRSKVTSQFGRYYSLKSLQALNVAEMRSMQQSCVNPPNASGSHNQGFFCKCVESFKLNFPKIRQWAEDLFYEPVEPTSRK